MIRFSFFILCGISLLSCKSDEVFINKDYLPLVNAAEALFEVQETNYRLQEPIQKRIYYIKERIADREELANGAFRCNLETYIFNSANSNWNLVLVVPIKKQGTAYIFSIKNIEQLLMIQPLSEGEVWNVNAYNSQKESKIKEVTLSENLRNFNNEWSDLAKITFQADSSLLEKNLLLNYYKNQVGLVYSQSQNLVYCQETPDCIGKKQISYGTEIIKKRISKLP